MKSPTRALRLFLVLAWLMAFWARPVGAQTPPAEFSTNLTQGATTLGFHFVYHPIRNPNFTVQVQTSAGTFTNFTPDVPRTYLGWSSNAPDALACATLLPDGTLWARVAFGDGFTWYFQNGTATASSTRGTTNWSAKWPTTPTLGPGGAGTNIYAATVGVDVRWTYFNACGGDLNTLVRHVEQSVMAANLYYLQDAGLLHRIERIVVRGSQAVDPYETTASSLLSEEHNQWKYTLPAALGVGMPDVSVLPSPGYGGGVAYLNGATTANGQAVTDVRSLEFDIVWRHEVGHNWGSGDNQGGNAEGGTIMNGNGLGRFAGAELYKMVGYRNTRLGSLEKLGPYSFPIPPYAALDLAYASLVGTATIDVLANDHDANGDAIQILSFDATSAKGATITRSVGPGGRDRLSYTANPSGGVGLDRFTYRLRDASGMETLGNVFVQVTPSLDALAGHWPLDETNGTTAADASGLGNDGTWQGGVAPVGGMFGHALRFDGANGSVALPALNLNTNTVTFTCWVRRDGAQNASAGLVFCRGGTTAAGLNFGPANELRYTWDGAANTSGFSSGLTLPDGQWAFVALVVEANRARLYLDDGTGLRAATNNVSHNVEAFDAGTYFGWDASAADRHFRGELDDVHIFPRALNAAEIAALAQAGGTASQPSPAVGSTVLAGPQLLRWTMPAAATGHQVYLGTNYLAVAGATTFSPEYLGETTNALFTTPALPPGTWFWRVDEVCDSTVIRGPVWFFTAESDAVAARWALNETGGTTAFDVNGVNDGAFVGSPLPGQSGVSSAGTNAAVRFNGSSQYVEVPYAATLNPAQFTVAVWCRVLGGQGTLRVPLMSRAVGGPPAVTQGFGFAAGADNVWQFWTGSGDSNANTLTGPVVTTNDWVQLVGTCDGSTLAFYVNGVRVDAVDAAFAPNASRPLRIAAGNTEGAAAGFFNGLVDDVRVYDRALSDAEVASLYASDGDHEPVWRVSPLPAMAAAPGQSFSNSVAGLAADPDGDALMFAKVSGPAWLNIAADGTLSGTPTLADAGLNMVAVRCADGAGAMADVTLPLVVSGAIWSGGGSDGQWSTGANWQGVAPEAGATLLFQGLAHRNNTNNLLAGVHQLVLGGSGFALSGNPIALDAGVVNLGGGNVCDLPLTLRAAQSFDSGDGVLQLNRSVNLAGHPLTVSGAGEVTVVGSINGAGAVVVRRGATLAMTGPSSFVGDTFVLGGTLALRNNGSLASTNLVLVDAATVDAAGRADGTVTLRDGQMLLGDGQVHGRLTALVGSTLAPGNGVGTWNVDGDLTLRGSTLLELRKTGAALAQDRIAVGGVVDCGGTVIVTNLGGVFASGDRFQLLTGAGFTNDFAEVILPALPAGLQWANTLAQDGALSVVAAPPTNLVTSVTNGLWTAGATWSNGAAPAVTNNYVALHQVQSPDDNDHTFAGNSLTVEGGGRLYLYRSNSGGSLNVFHRVASLALFEGAEVRWASSLGSEQHFLTNAPLINIAGDVSFYATGGSYSLGLTIGGVTGNGTITYTVNRNYASSAAPNALNVTRSSPNYSGNWVVNYANAGDDFAVLNASAANALGTGVVTLQNRGWLQNQAAGGLNSLAGVTLASSSAQFVLNQPWVNANAALTAISGATLNLGNGASTIGSLTIGGFPEPAGTYTAAQLGALGLNASGSGTLTVVALPATPPGFAADPITGAAATNNIAYAGTLAGAASDPNGGGVTYQKLAGPAWLAIAADGALSGTPGRNDLGTAAFLVQATDDRGLHAEAVLQIVVVDSNQTNHPPAFSSNPISGTAAHEDEAYQGTLAAFAVDADPGDLLTFHKLAGPAWLSVASDGTLSGTPAGGDGGTNSFTVSVVDLAGATNQTTLLIWVGTFDVIPSVANGFWDAGTTWSDGAAPAGTNRYLGRHQIQSPDDADHTFAGHSLTLTNGGTLYLYRSNAGSSLDVYHRVPGLMLEDGATVRFRSSNGSVQHFLPNLVTIAGAVTFLSTDTSYDNNLTLGGGVDGQGAINYVVNRNASGARQNQLNVTATSPGYAGDWVVDYANAGDDYAVLDAEAANALGTGSVTLRRRSWLRCLASGGLDSLTNVTLGTNSAQLILTSPWVNPAATLTAASGAAINLGASTSVVSSLVVDGNVVPGGNYDASALSSLGLVATGAGTLTVGAVPVEPSEPPTLSVTQTGDTLTLAWAPAYTSFALYVQTNVLAAGLGTNWFPVPGVVSNVVTVPVNRGLPAVFYQLRKP